MGAPDDMAALEGGQGTVQLLYGRMRRQLLVTDRLAEGTIVRPNKIVGLGGRDGTYFKIHST
jgi:hypothetical protein